MSTLAETEGPEIPAPALLPRLDEDRGDALDRVAADKFANAPTEENVSYYRSEKINKAVALTGAVLALAAFGVAKEGRTIAKPVNSLIQWVGQEFSHNKNGLPIPKPAEATTVRVGDTIRYTVDGQVKERQVRMLSDIALAAQLVNVANYNAVDDLLERELGNPEFVQPGAEVTIPKGWGITDVSKLAPAK